MMDLRLLGPVEIRAEDQILPPGRPQQAAVLAVLAAEVGRPVSAEVIVDRVWGPDPALSARRTLHTHITRLRALLQRAGRCAVISRSAGGYMLEAEPAMVDLHRFKALAAAGRDAAATGSQRLSALREALVLWRGTPLSGIPGQWAERTRSVWQQQYRSVLAAWARLETEHGDPETVLSRLSDPLADWSGDESIALERMRALRAAGRPAEALNAYAAIRQALAEQLGTDPGPELQAFHLEVLRGTPAASPAGQAPAAQLPRDPYGFTGRGGELAELDGNRGLVVISGTAGVGKTALALHWAHRRIARFPDGQLYTNLHGFGPGASAVDPSDALSGFLTALGIQPDRIPATLAEQAALYRSLMAGRRALVIADNARDADQVRPLLPGSATCTVLVTSRKQLSGLLAAEGAQHLALDVLAEHEAWQMLALRLGRERVEAEAGSAGEIIERCARLPLALGIAAARAMTHATFKLRVLADELRDPWEGLNILGGEDSGTDISAVFSWSYRCLSPAAARLFRLLGIHPCPDIGLATAASLAAVSVAEAGRLITELSRASLVNEHRPARYAVHDLMRAYATQLVSALDSQQDRDAALLRILDHYLHSAVPAALVLHPHRQAIAVGTPAPGVVPETTTTLPEALAWFGDEREALICALREAERAGFDTHAWQLAWAVGYYFVRNGSWRDLESAQSIAVAAAERTGDRYAAASAHRGLGRALTWLRKLDEAHDHLSHALELFAQLDDAVAVASSHQHLAEYWSLQGRPAQARLSITEALSLYRSMGNLPGQATALNNLGYFHAQAGDFHLAIESCEEALAILNRIGDRNAEGATWDSLGLAHRLAGNLATSINCYLRSVELRRDLGQRYPEAKTLTMLGHVYHEAGQPQEANLAWQRALELLTELRHPDVDAVSTLLNP